MGCFDWCIALWYGGRLLLLIHRIVIRRWVVTIGTLHGGSEVAFCDWSTILWFGGGLFRLVLRIVVRRWVVPIGTPYCGSEVGCSD